MMQYHIGTVSENNHRQFIIMLDCMNDRFQSEGSDDDDDVNIVTQPEPIIENENDPNISNSSKENGENLLRPVGVFFLVIIIKKNQIMW